MTYRTKTLCVRTKDGVFSTGDYGHADGTKKRAWKKNPTKKTTCAPFYRFVSFVFFIVPCALRLLRKKRLPPTARHRDAVAAAPDRWCSSLVRTRVLYTYAVLSLTLNEIHVSLHHFPLHFIYVRVCVRARIRLERVLYATEKRRCGVYETDRPKTNATRPSIIIV